MRGELDWIVMKALEKDRNRRYETANAFAADIERYLHDEPVAACPPSAWYRLKKFAHRKKLALMTAGLALCFILLLGGCVGWVVRDRGARREQTATDIDVALREAQRLQDQQKWAEALAVVKQAQALLNSGGGDEELRQRLRERAADLDLLIRLEDSRLSWAAVKGNTLNYREADTAFARAFQEHGIDVETLAPAEAGPLLRRGRSESSWRRRWTHGPTCSEFKESRPGGIVSRRLGLSIPIPSAIRSERLLSAATARRWRTWPAPIWRPTCPRRHSFC